ncbi:MAG: hypoxanthine phosphoribosyltransferase [Bacteroidales bacterium]|nr:hypoxanthine phosphoribosyltransferase [Bacteroidales bacterium]MDD2424861.1 hypoxanthine phosphoribosyltransferase [Bacteroidales bacterium]MDD3990087.1 hypoxanthine phosphoribosyltransferase [Bacteroidales bacterium]
MNRIKLHDKYFKIFIPYEKIEESIIKVAGRLNRDYINKNNPLFLSVLNGSFMFAAHLMKYLSFDNEISFIRLSSYSGTSSTGEVKQLLGFDRPLKGRDVIILEDIVDTGETIAEMYNMMLREQVASVKICTLLLKPAAYRYSDTISVDYAAIEIPNDFIVGFGLDYDELGRNYKDIYVLDK